MSHFFHERSDVQGYKKLQQAAWFYLVLRITLLIWMLLRTHSCQGIRPSQTWLQPWSKVVTIILYSKNISVGEHSDDLLHIVMLRPYQRICHPIHTKWNAIVSRLVLVIILEHQVRLLSFLWTKNSSGEGIEQANQTLLTYKESRHKFLSWVF